MKNTAIFAATYWRTDKKSVILSEIAERIDEVLAGSSTGCFVVTTITRNPTEAEVKNAQEDATPEQKAARAEAERKAAEMVEAL